MSDLNKQQQSGVATPNPQQQQQQQQQPQQQQQQQAQQQVEGQAMQVQISHDGTDQMQATQVASSNTTMNPTSTMVMAAPQQALISQQTMQNLQNPPAIAPMPSQGGSTTITTMSTGPPQQMTEWPAHGRVQVIQQPIQNPTYIQPVYNAQGQLIVPGNIAVHPGNMNPPIQVITAGKPFQPGQMPHMLTTTQAKPIVQGQTATFPSYATIPTSGSNQTLVISQLGVLGQTNILQQQQQQQQGKPQEMQKIITKTNVTANNIKAAATPQQNVSIANLVSSQAQGITTQAQAIIQPQILSPIQYTCNTQQQRTVPQAATPTMQFAPWQATFGATGLPQGLTWTPGAIQSSALLTQGGQLFIRNPQQEQTGMFIHNTQGTTVNQHNQISGQQINKPAQQMEINSSVQCKTPIPKAFSAILPNAIGGQQLRPASSVSTQTGQTQTSVHQTNFRGGTKQVRTKNVCRMPSMAAIQKTDAGNQTKVTAPVQVLQQKLLISNVSPGTTVAVPQENKLIKQTSGINHQGSNQQQQQQQQGQQQQQQPLAQIQQMFQESLEQKPQPGQLLIGNAIQNGGERAVVPVVSMPPGQMAPIVGNMILQTMPGVATMTSGMSLPAGQTVQNVPLTQEIIATANALPLSSTVKQENLEQKDAAPQENGVIENGPGRPGEDSNCGSEESLNAGNLSDNKLDRSRVTELDDSIQDKDKLLEDKEGEKKVDKDGAMLSQTKATMMVKPQVLTHVIEGFVIQESSEPFPVSRNGSEGLSRKMPLGDNSDDGGTPTKKSRLEDGKESPSDENKINPLKWTVSEVCEFIRNLPGCSDYVDDFAMQDIDGEALMLLKPDHLMSAMSMKLGPAVKIIAKIDTMRVNTPSSSKDGI